MFKKGLFLGVFFCATIFGQIPKETLDRIDIQVGLSIGRMKTLISRAIDVVVGHGLRACPRHKEQLYTKLMQAAQAMVICPFEERAACILVTVMCKNIGLSMDDSQNICKTITDASARCMGDISEPLAITIGGWRIDCYSRAKILLAKEFHIFAQEIKDMVLGLFKPVIVHSSSSRATTFRRKYSIAPYTSTLQILCAAIAQKSNCPQDVVSRAFSQAGLLESLEDKAYINKLVYVDTFDIARRYLGQPESWSRAYALAMSCDSLEANSVNFAIAFVENGSYSDPVVFAHDVVQAYQSNIYADLSVYCAALSVSENIS